MNIKQIVLLVGIVFLVDCKLRAPAVPLVVTDPYNSIWSMNDNLSDGYTTHWAGVVSPMLGLLKIDDDCYRFMGPRDLGNLECGGVMKQVSYTVHATRTEYELTVEGQLNMTLTFTTPARLDDMDQLAIPLTYLDFNVTLLSTQSRSVAVYYDNTPEVAINTRDEQITWQQITHGSLNYLQTGTLNQIFNEGKSDRITWGHFYVVSPVDSNTTATVALDQHCRNGFAFGQPLPPLDLDSPRQEQEKQAVLAVRMDYGQMVQGQNTNKYIGLIYDQERSIYYFGQFFQPLWRHQWKNVFNLMSVMMVEEEKNNLQQQLRQFDNKVRRDLEESFEGSKESQERMGEMGSLAYRQVTGSLQLVHNHVLNKTWAFMKEISSDGDVSTVDVIYPAFPIFYLMNPELFFLIMQPVLDYASDQAVKYGRDIKYDLAWAPHHLGVWPVCDLTQDEQEQMPMEETANMLILIQLLVKLDKEKFLSLFAPYNDLLDKWGQYLLSTLPDPKNQLCTDDFEGPSPHNINLAAKGILGLASYSQYLNDRQVPNAHFYLNITKVFVDYWEQNGLDPGTDHFKMQFDKPGSWSMKYNLALQEPLGFSLFSKDIINKELSFYFSKKNLYGIPLDDRATFTITYWLYWVGAMGSDEQFEEVVNMNYRFLDQTWQRVPMTDWYDTIQPTQMYFRARPTVGSLWMKQYLNHMKNLNNKHPQQITSVKKLLEFFKTTAIY